MKYIDEFRKIHSARHLAKAISEAIPDRQVNIMEVCGTHTMSFYRFGLDKMLPANLRLISGPGCPVCVSPQSYIDNAINLAGKKDTLIVSFADMLRVPGTSSTLEKERAKHGNVHIALSALDALRFAKLNPSKKVVFLAVGFETTIPTIALSMAMAKKEKIKNLFFLSSLKVIPPAMAYLLKDKSLKLDGFLCPGHVSAITGSKCYDFIPRKYKIGCCIAGFEPLDMLCGIYLLVKQVAQMKPAVANQYDRVVTRAGNLKAQKIIAGVFSPCDAEWRGLGVIPKSGLRIKKEFSSFDAEKEFGIKVRSAAANYRSPKCKCGEVLKGRMLPAECSLFKRSCTPDNPYGPCMVSTEGACNVYYKYR